MGRDTSGLWRAKIALSIAMLAVAAFTRQRLTPRLADARSHRGAIRQLQWNSLAEVGLGLLILVIVAVLGRIAPHAHRSEEHTSELQSHLNLVCRLLLEKKKLPPQRVTGETR